MATIEERRAVFAEYMREWREKNPTKTAEYSKRARERRDKKCYDSGYSAGYAAGLAAAGLTADATNTNA